jgi:hypothetical protein
MDSPSKPIPVVLVLAEPLGGAPVDELRGVLADLLASTGAASAWCDVRALQRPGVRAAGVLARLRLVADELDRSFLVVRAPRQFVALLELLGLCDALPCTTDRDDRDPFAADPGSTW